MAFTKPTLPDLRERSRKDMYEFLTAAPLTFRASLLDVLSDVHAGSMHGLYGALDYYSKQLFPQTATGDYLNQALLWRGISRLPAVKAQGSVKFTGSNGATIPIGLVVQSDSGLNYTTTENGEITGGELSLNVIAEEAGEKYNLLVNSKLTLTIALLGVNNEALVTSSEILGGREEEDDEAYRVRALEFITSPNTYGKKGDYILWALEATNEVKKAWETVNYNNEGTLLIQVIGENNTQVSQTGINLVKDYLKQYAPVGVYSTVKTPTPINNNFSISITPDTVNNRSLVQSTLQDWYNNNSAPAKTISISTLQNLIVSLPEITTAIISLPALDIQHNIDEYPILGTITWVA